MNTCPCCSSRLLRHIHGHVIYWFCRHCWEVMPVLTEQRIALPPEFERGGLAKILEQQNKICTAARDIEFHGIFAEANVN
ncbi:hypothetical protein G7B40_004795 [Aetokthonos hydrillicola Thurmond2011]|uniref:Uncharacterized protein n=1 Tax=Aetokthonos hydrillicola Thurmond2011 TaxID=2712845 RepID=A0AAP5I520_9CYAN|nr:hypothetical protein [Aetokthonos hydrillicola]MBO3458320.1 hypothetical protein [Aetokthonos hydrillicola CCALA 1050]MBW4585883.1 hypothetical protein [Aetokthonos hydrillicola CCALA 1050]MDR9893892.1 hypothetical protein [Aetokthonos hydrillicola Thurmond2011]